MPQARLPDINSSFMKYRNEVIVAIKNKDWVLMHGSLNAINAILPESYRVIVSSKDYYKITKVEITYICNFCEHPNKKESITIFDTISNVVGGLIYGDAIYMIWICKQCTRTNRLSETLIDKPKLQNPSFLGVVIDPPERKDGLMNRLVFNRTIAVWGLTLLKELEAKEAQFRDDNWNRGDMFDMDIDIDTVKEESE